MGRGGARPNTGPVPLKVVTLPTCDPESLPADVGPWRGMLTETACSLYQLLREAACGTRRLTIREMESRLHVHARRLPLLFLELCDRAFIHIMDEREKNPSMPAGVLLFGPPEPPDVKEEARLTREILQREHVDGAAFIDWYREKYAEWYDEPLKVQRWHYGQVGYLVARCRGLEKAKEVAEEAHAQHGKLSIGGVIHHTEDILELIMQTSADRRLSEEIAKQFTPIPTMEADKIRDQLLIASHLFGGGARKALARWTAAEVEQVYECSPKIAELAIRRIRERLSHAPRRSRTRRT